MATFTHQKYADRLLNKLRVQISGTKVVIKIYKM